MRPCCFEGCPRSADNGPALEVAVWDDQFNPEPRAVSIAPCAEHRAVIVTELDLVTVVGG